MQRSIHRATTLALFLALGLGLAACAKQADQAAEAADAEEADGAPAAVAGQRNREGGFLAYEHDVEVRMPAREIAPRVAAVRLACMDERFGGCTVLGESQGAGEFPHGRLQVRAAPEAVEKLVALAADGAEISQRTTRADDLADAVRDNGLRRRRLENQHARLSELASRPAKLEDLINLNQQLANLEAELQQAEQEAAQHKRRIDTNLLTLEFVTQGVTAETSATRQALRGLGDIWDRSLATLVTVVGALLPFALFGLLVWLAVRGVRRVLRGRPTP